MARIQLVHWKEEEGRQRARELRGAGLRVEYEADGPTALRAAREEPPAVVLIDLTRLPSHGREMAWALRQNKKTRGVPLVFVGGAPEKVERVRKELPDAVFTSWEKVVPAVERAQRAPPRDPVVPKSTHFYGSKPLAGKLGLKEGGRLRLVGAPKGFEKAMGELPTGAKTTRGPAGACDVLLTFVTTQKALRGALAKWKKAAEDGSRVWVAWPKKTSSVPTDLSQEVVRKIPLTRGLVDYKICAIDADWSGMCFGLRRK